MAGLELGLNLARLNPALHVEVTLEAERLGFESVWLPEHLVFPARLTGSPYAGEEHPPVPPTTPVFDCFAYLAYLAGRTSRIRLGSYVYLLALRHPFAGARAVQTLDLVSGGRAEVGIGAGWLEGEFRAAGIEFASRGRRLDEAIVVCKHLFSDETFEYKGEFFEFGPVVFEPKPVQKPWPPLLVGGESERALRRAARMADGWIGMHHTIESVGERVERLRALRTEAETLDSRFSVTVAGEVRERADLERWREAGVDRVLVAPWRRSREALDGVRRFAERVLD